MSNKNWKFERDKHGRCNNKFNRHVVNNTEGNRLSMRKTPRIGRHTDWCENYFWINRKFIVGLLNKYKNKSIKELEEAYNERIKVFKGKCVPSFKDEFDWYIADLNPDKKVYRHTYDYVIKDGILIKQPKRHYKSCYLNPARIRYNKEHIINPGKVRKTPYHIPEYSFEDKYQVNDIETKFRQPIYLGELYCKIGKSTIKKCPVYNYLPYYLTIRFPNGTQLKQIEEFNKEWIKVDIGIKTLDYFIENDNYGFSEIHPVIKR